MNALPYAAGVTYEDLPLAPQHVAQLRASAIDPAVATERGYATITKPNELGIKGFKEAQRLVPTMLVPVYDVTGAIGMYSHRPDRPRQDRDGKDIKYETPAGATICLDVPTRIRHLLRDPTTPLLFTEGSKKVDAAVSAGLRCIGVVGVWGFRGKDDWGGKAALPCFDSIALNGRPTGICFDSDVMVKRGVHHALGRFARFLRQRGAHVSFIYLPGGPGGEKVGLDDYLAAGHSAEDVMALATEELRPPPREDAATDEEGKPVIDIAEQDLLKLTEQSWAAVVRGNEPPRLFLFGGLPVRIERDALSGAPLPRDLTEDRLRCEADHAARYVKTSEKFGRAPAFPPLAVIRTMLAVPVIPLPVLLSVTEAPAFAADGSLPAGPGYHAAARAYYAPAEGFRVPPIPESPTMEQVGAARDLLLGELLADFPFTADPERAHAVALLLLPFVRGLIDGPTPLHLVEKPTAGTGASLLVEVVARVATGRPAAAMTEGRDEDEWRKRITAKLREGEALVLIDNLRRRLDSASVSAALTATVWGDRLLGTSEMVRVPVRCAWVGTGNNPALSSEITRRSVRVRMDAKRDRPWLREGFRHPDLTGWATERRAELVAACLTLGRAWLVAGRPVPAGLRPLGSFEGWSRTMGGILEVAGVPGFLGNLAEFYEQSDIEGEAIRGFLRAWWEKHQGAAVGVADLFTIATAPESGLDLGDKGERSQRIRLGGRLRELRGRHYQLAPDLTVRVAEGGVSHQAQLWRLAATTTADAGGECGESGESFSSAPGCETSPYPPDSDMGPGAKHSPHSPHSPVSLGVARGAGVAATLCAVDGCAAPPEHDGDLYCAAHHADGWHERARMGER